MATGFNTQTGGGQYRLQFETDNEEYFLLMQELARCCVDHPAVRTNADRIRAMTDEELADWLARTQIANVAEALSIAGFPWGMDSELYDGTKMECLEWLRQPAEESHG